MRRVAVLAVVLVVASIGGAVTASAGAAGAATANNSTATATSTPTSTPASTPSDSTGEPSSEWTLDELDRRGTIVSDWAPSRRPLGSYGSITAMNYPAKPWVEFGGKGWTDLTPSTTVKRDRLFFVSNRFPRDGPVTTLTFKLILWERGTREVVEGNQTVERPAAVNVTVHETKKEIPAGNANVELSLPKEFDGKKQATLLVLQDGERLEGALWRFEYRTSPTQRSSTTDTLGEDLWWALTTLGVPLVIGMGAGGSAGAFARRRVGYSPRKSRSFYLRVALVVGFLAVGMLWTNIAGVLTRIEPVIGLPAIVLGFGFAVRRFDPPQRALIRQILDDEATLATGKEGRGALKSGGVLLPFIRRPDGTPVYAPSGMRSWLAALVAGPAVVHDYKELDVDLPSLPGSTWSEEWALKSGDELNVRIEKPHWNPTPPEPTRGLATFLIVGLAAGGAVATAAGLSVWFGGFGALACYGFASLDIRSGGVEFSPATVHEQRAETTAMLLSRDIEDAQTIDELRDLYHRELGKGEAKRREAKSDSERSVLSEVFDGDEPDAERPEVPADD